MNKAELTRSNSMDTDDRRLRLARFAWFGTLLLVLSAWIPAFQHDTAFFANFEWTPVEIAVLRRLNLSQQVVLLYIMAFKVVNLLVYLGTAAVIFWRRYNDYSAVVISIALIPAGSVTTWVFVSVPSGQAVLYFLSNLVSLLGWFLFVLLFFIFPDARFFPRSWRWLTIPLILYFLASLLYRESNFSLFSEHPLSQNITGVVFGLGLWAQILRYRRFSTPRQRQQTKWVLSGFVFLFLLIGLIQFASNAFPELENPNTLYGAVYRLFFMDLLWRIAYMALPISLGIAIMRSRLYEIDVIIRRTLQYAILSALLAFTYFGGVVLLQTLFGGLTGDANSPLFTVLSTLAIAVLFNPLRTRVQDFIDHRFYRRKYNAERALAQFASTARDEVDVERLSRSLLSTVEKNIQPERSSLWLLE